MNYILCLNINNQTHIVNKIKQKDDPYENMHHTAIVYLNSYLLNIGISSKQLYIFP